MQSELLPSACMVELPSKPQLGRSARVGGCSNALSSVLPRNSGIGVLPSSQMYSSLYFVMSAPRGGLFRKCDFCRLSLHCQRKTPIGARLGPIDCVYGADCQRG